MACWVTEASHFSLSWFTYLSNRMQSLALFTSKRAKGLKPNEIQDVSQANCKVLWPYKERDYQREASGKAIL